jgi:hypothetical protein
LYRQFVDSSAWHPSGEGNAPNLLLPVEFFKNFQVSTTEFQPQMILKAVALPRPG